MSTVTLAADATTLILNGTPILDFIAGDIFDLNPINPLTSQVMGSVGVNINKRSDADARNLVFRVLRYSDDDVFLNSAANSEALTIFNGSAKTSFNKDGIAGVESWILEAGSITTQPTIVYNDTDGNSSMEYTIMFRFTQRNI